MKKHAFMTMAALAGFACRAETVSYENKVDLAGKWTLVQAGDPKVTCPIDVPGDVHTALYAAGIIPDPYYGANEYRTLWVGRKDWIVSRTFAVDAKLLASESVVLRLDEVDTFCTIRLNGHELPRMDNRFRRWDFGVKGFLREGGNTIEARFESAEKVTEALAAANKEHFHIQNSWATSIMFARKPQCHGGWDWGIDMMTAGFLGKVELVGTKTARIDYVWCDQKFSDGYTSCDVTVTAEVFSPAGGETEFSVDLGGNVRSKKLTLAKGDNLLRLPVTLANPRLWWPNGEGEQHLYPLVVKVGPASLSRKLGLRKLEVVTEPDAAPYARLGRKGTNFCFRVNGRDIFAKGANWIPCDGFESRQTPEKYRNLVKSSRDANMNMLRIWGGGRFEGDAFYEACDEFGVLLWHDFMFSCALYPDDDWFYDQVRAEEAHQIRRLRDHASIALWSGDNECISLITGDGGWPQELKSHTEHFIRRAKVSEAMVAKYDPTRRFWASSPSSTGRPEDILCRDDDRGDIHNWSIWFGWQPYWGYYKRQPRFVSEFGCQSMPSADVASTVCSEEAIDKLLPELMYHQKHPLGHRRLTEFLHRHFFAPASARDFIYLTQAFQAMSMKVACEHLRSLRPWCMGVLVWQLNDNWPVASWSSIDYGGKWKPLQYQLKRTFAPVLITAAPTEKSYAARKTRDLADKYDDRAPSIPYDMRAYAVNDSNGELDATLTLTAVGFDGSAGKSEILKAKLPPRTSVTMAEFSEALFGDWEARKKSFVLLTLETRNAKGGTDTVRNEWFFDEFRNLPLAAANVKADVAEEGGKWTVTLKTDKPAFFVWANAYKIAGEFNDNSITLLPGETKKLVFEPWDKTTTFADFRKALSVNTLEKGKAK